MVIGVIGVDSAFSLFFFFCYVDIRIFILFYFIKQRPEKDVL